MRTNKLGSISWEEVNIRSWDGVTWLKFNVLGNLLMHELTCIHLVCQSQIILNYLSSRDYSF